MTRKEAKNTTKQKEQGIYVAIVPVKIAIEHAGTILQEYEDDIDIPFDDTTSEGKQYIAQLLYLTSEKGLSTESALFTIASEAVHAEAKHITAHVSSPTYHELQLRVQRNGDITYRKYI
jgi:hypothetical protein